MRISSELHQGRAHTLAAAFLLILYSSIEMQALRGRFDAGEAVDLYVVPDPHLVAGALKLWYNDSLPLCIASYSPQVPAVAAPVPDVRTA